MQLKLFIVCVFSSFFNLSFGQTAEDILSRYFKASSNGDITTWNEIKTLYATTEGYYSQKSFEAQDGTFDRKNLCYAKLYKRWPDEQKEELFSDSLFMDHTSSFYFLKNRRVIILGFMDPLETFPDEKSTFDFYPLRINKYMRNSKSITYNGIKKIPGKSEACFEVVIKTRERSHVLLFNTETYLLEAIYFSESDVYWTLSDYKRFDGYLLPTHISSMKNGVIFSWTQYKTFEFNVQFGEHKFDPQYEDKKQLEVFFPSEVLNINETTLQDFVKENFPGKRVFVDMWATWCSPCKWEFKNYDTAYYSLMENEAISLVYLSIDNDADKKKWEADVDKLGLKGFHARATKELIQSIQELIFEGGSIIIPRYILIDNDGTIISRDFMRPSNPAFREELFKALNMK